MTYRCLPRGMARALEGRTWVLSRIDVPSMLAPDWLPARPSEVPSKMPDMLILSDGYAWGCTAYGGAAAIMTSQLGLPSNTFSCEVGRAFSF